MKVLHLLPRIFDQSSGPSYSVPRLCDALQNEGMDVELGVLSPEPAQKPICKNPILSN